MRRSRTAAMGLAMALIAGLFTMQNAPAAKQRFAIEREEHVVKTRFGKIYVLVSRPVRRGHPVKAPAILTYSPYSVLGAPPHHRRNSDDDFWVPKGYVRVWADVVGTGNSGGCWDYGGRREKLTGRRIVEWIADRRWSTGKVGMIGGSYEGTTATATAVTRPPHLTTIVPEAAISRWYGYAYSGGIRYFWTNEPLSHQGGGAAADEGFDTPAAFDFGLAVPPPLDAAGPGWADRVTSTITPCQELRHTRHGYDKTPDYTRFWKQRDYLRGARNIDIPVLISHNWGDWNVKQEEAINLFERLRHSRNVKLYMGTRWAGHGTPPGQRYEKTVVRWFAHHLKGRHNGIARMPRVTSQRSTSAGAGRYYRGPWPDTERRVLYAQAVGGADAPHYPWKLMPRRPRARSAGASFPSTGTNSESQAAMHPRANLRWFWFESPPLAKATRIFGR
ncbi:MAG: CocE/NonD family hydrolase, partial [Actinomycetota bacterium]